MDGNREAKPRRKKAGKRVRLGVESLREQDYDLLHQEGCKTQPHQTDTQCARMPDPEQAELPAMVFAGQLGLVVSPLLEFCSGYRT